jgi:1,5-anhydro-D-fructose reductase (1,5-anhydro-D-mannitol-forming)
MIRYGIAGFGLHAVKRLMPGFSEAKNCQVVALSRRTREKAQASAQQYGIPLAFDSVEALCAHPEVDAVLVTTPNAMHLQDVLAACRHRKPVLCEKPMGVSARECRMMVEQARNAGVLLGVAHVFRFEQSTARLRERLASGQIGEPVFARSEFSFPATPDHPREWLNDAAIAGGGPVADVGVHCIDTLRFVLQDEVVEVAAQGRTDALSGSVESACAMTLRFSRGTLASVLVSFRAEYRTPLEIVGKTGVLRADNALNVERPVSLQLHKGWDLVEEEVVSNAGAYTMQVDAFARALQGKEAYPVPGEEGWQNQEILDAVYRSLANGRVEKVKAVRDILEAKVSRKS